ncbi:MAG: sigma factor-like helix-turn-helix DNA-binding protein, partial [Candidatus Neomarinimicrobiota bacterium]
MERVIASPIDSDIDDHEADPLDISELEPYLNLIPPREVDLIDMYYHKEKKQKEIASFFSISQGAVSHRLTRAIK